MLVGLAMGATAMTALFLLFSFSAGGLAGITHFSLIAKDADLLVRGGSVAAAAGLRLTRLLMTTGVLLFSVLHGWQTLLAAALGFLLARQSVLVRHRDAP